MVCFNAVPGCRTGCGMVTAVADSGPYSGGHWEEMVRL